MRLIRVSAAALATLAVMLGAGACERTARDARADSATVPDTPLPMAGGDTARATDIEQDSMLDGPREGVIDLAIREVDGSEDYTFGLVGGVVADARGRIYVADSPTGTIHVFGPDGRFLHRISRKGPGPGELGQPCCLALGDSGRTLWVRDAGRSSYVAFTLGDTSASYLRTVRMAHSEGDRWAPLTFDAAGNLIDIGTVRQKLRGGYRMIGFGRYHLDSTGLVVSVDTVPEPPADSLPVRKVERTMPPYQATFLVTQPFGPTSLVAYAPGGAWARAVSSRYSVGWHGADGRLIGTLEQPLRGPPLSARERAQAEDEVQRSMKKTGQARGEFPFGIPDRKPPLRSLTFDQDGRLWVEHAVVDGEASRADVYGRDGRLLYEVTWPARAELTGAARGDLFYAIQLDSLDTPSVLRLRITPRRAPKR